ncbi:MAG: OmpH family outer membrane protein [Verrucomicrobiota bacterium]
MKKILIKSLVVAFTCFGAVAAQAQTVKILSFNGAKVNAGYYKSQILGNALGVKKASAESVILNQRQALEQLSADYQAIAAKFRNTPETDTAGKADLDKQATLKSETFNKTRDALQKTINDEQELLNKQNAAAQQEVVKDILEAANTVAKKQNATVVLDINNVVYIDTTLAKDITDDVLAELNKGHEKELAKPTEAAKPADAKPAAK